MPLTKRKFFIQCLDDECFKLADLIREKIPQVEQIDITITSHGLYITMYGYKTDIRNAWKYIRELITGYKSAITEQGGIKKVKINFLVEKIKHTFPPRLLIEILRLKGYNANYDKENNLIETTAPLNEIEDIVKKIVSIMEDIKYKVAGTTTKYYVIGSSVLTGLLPSEIFEKGTKYGYLYIDEDGKYRLRIDWRKALEDFMRKLKEDINGERMVSNHHYF